MAERRARLVYRMLEGWPYPAQSQVDTPFSAPWSATVDLLLREADALGARLVVVGLDVASRAIRKDDQLRSDARAYSEKVRVSMETGRGAMSWHTDRYVLPRGGGLGWRENIRAIALTLEALRTVDRYGAVHTGEQYRGFLAIEAGPSATGTGFANADAAERWLRAEGAWSAEMPLRDVVRAARAVLHPDRCNGDRSRWDQLERAVGLLRAAGLLGGEHSG